MIISSCCHGTLGLQGEGARPSEPRREPPRPRKRALAPRPTPRGAERRLGAEVSYREYERYIPADFRCFGTSLRGLRFAPHNAASGVPICGLIVLALDLPRRKEAVHGVL